MLQYILRILGFVLLVTLGFCIVLKDFVFGDIKEAWSELKDCIVEAKLGGLSVLRGEPFL